MLTIIIDFLKSMNSISKRLFTVSFYIFLFLYLIAFIVWLAAGRQIEYYYGLECIHILVENAKGLLLAGTVPAILFDPVYKQYVYTE